MKIINLSFIIVIIFLSCNSSKLVASKQGKKTNSTEKEFKNKIDSKQFENSNVLKLQGSSPVRNEYIENEVEPYGRTRQIPSSKE